MNLIELNAIKSHLAQQLADLEGIAVNCRSCTKYDGQCSQYQATPPEDWLHGSIDCEHWNWDQIPF
jgi:hypothetical protein